MTALYSITIFLGAALLFLVQPMIGKMVLPRLGGSPSVWNTCMVFFQAALLVGYGYAHLLQRTPKRGVQLGVHALALGSAAIVLPFAIAPNWSPANAASPALSILMLLAGMVALPFALVSTTGPLLQRWYSMTGAKGASDPYFLYAASNAGSLLGLLAYPVLVEPAFTLQEQARGWAFGYAGYALLVVVCGAAMVRSSGRPAVAVAAVKGTVAPKPGTPLAPPSAKSQARWLVLAMVPSSLCMGVTHYLSTDVASVPFLWVLPLAVYLLTFIIAFSRWCFSAAWMGLGLIVAALVAAGVQLTVDHPSIPVSLLLHLAILFFGGTLCHGELSRSRPEASRLTGFYLLISLGGVLGGVFNALVAPVLFSASSTYPIAAVWEYPIAIVAAILLIPTGRETTGPTGRLRRVGLLMGAVTVAGALAATVFARDYKGDVIHRERTFFGVHVVAEYVGHDKNGAPFVFHTLWHGTTNHGVEQMEPVPARREPRAYFHLLSPIGSIFMVAQRDELFAELAEERRRADGSVLRRPNAKRVAIIGMGAGSLAAYCRKGDEYTFYEIDPAVDRIARDPKLFAFVPEARGTVKTVIGDGRLKMAEAPDGSYDLIILDAFSSDSIPYHLLTREAIGVYLAKLAPGGLIAVHVSNVHLDLPPVVAAVAKECGLMSILWDYPGSPELRAQAKSGATWVALGRSEEDLAALNFGPGTWAPITPRPGDRAWTDDYSNLLGALKAFK